MVNRRIGAATAVVLAAVAPVSIGAQAGTAASGHIVYHADGTPNIEGVWRIRGFFGGYSIETPGIQLIHQNMGTRPDDPRTNVRSRVVDPPDGKVPYQRWARAKQQEVLEHHLSGNPDYLDPQARCFLTGPVRPFYMTQYQFLQSPGYVTVLFEYMHAYRQIPLEPRPRLSDKVHLFMGDAHGWWEGNQLVVDITNFNDTWWFDFVGSFHSKALRIVERFTVVDADTIDYEVTIDDPEVYTRPWRMAFTMERIREPGYELLEHACWEGNRFEFGR